jgi:hypothetical protein
MTGYQIFALSMPVITLVGVGLTGLFVQWHWGKRYQTHHREAHDLTGGGGSDTLISVDTTAEINADLDHAIRLIDGVRRKLKPTPN